MSGPIMSLILLGAIIFAIVVIVQGLRFRVIKVPQEERIVIYSLGRVSRVEGPGMVRIMTRYESVERTIYVRDQSLNITTSNVFINGVPFGYRLNLWCRYDIEEAAAGDEEKLKQLALYDDDERRRAIVVRIQKSLRDSIAEYEATNPLPDEPSLVDRLLPILPGMPACAEIMAGVRTRLMESLPTIGAILNTEQPINILSLILNKQMTDDFQRGRTVGQLRNNFPGLDDDVLAQMIASIEGISLPQIERLLVEQKGENNARVDVRRRSDGRKDTRVAFRGAERNDSTSEGIADDQDGESPAPEPARAKPAEIYWISRQDVEVLKSVPSRSNGQRKSA